MSRSAFDAHTYSLFLAKNLGILILRVSTNFKWGNLYVSIQIGLTS